jgi:pimeloyl-ACP methyl ester carboxylesterase
MDPTPYGLRSRRVAGVNGLDMHILEAGFDAPGRPLLLLLHGFPELAFSWRKVMAPLADAGYHVVAPDQRGYGLTTGWDGAYDTELAPFSMPSLVRDALALVHALGHRSVAAVVGHDFGSLVAAWCALIRPDVFRAVAMMSAPFTGPPSLPFRPADPAIHDALAALDPPRRHYQWYYAEREANEDLWHGPRGVHDFLRAYYHVKSADWPGNQPRPLAAWSATELAKLPTYYVMEARRGMAETVLAEMPSPAQVAACSWLTAQELDVYADTYRKTGFQGGLNWYRCAISDRFNEALSLFAGRTIDVPSCFISGAADWGIHQRPGALEAMQRSVCTRMLDCRLIAGAGHWVQQEQAEQTVAGLLDFLAQARRHG